MSLAEINVSQEIIAKIGKKVTKIVIRPALLFGVETRVVKKATELEVTET